MHLQFFRKHDFENTISVTNCSVFEILKNKILMIFWFVFVNMGPKTSIIWKTSDRRAKRSEIVRLMGSIVIYGYL